MNYSSHEVDKEVLTRVLRAIAIACPSVSYVQGMNYICAFLLTKCGEEESFILMYRLITNKRYSLNNLFKESFPHFDILSKQFYKALKHADIEVYNHLKNNNCNIAIAILVKHWLTLFTQTFILNDEERDKLWDLFFVQGWIPIIRLSGLILIRNRDLVLGCNENDLIGVLYAIYSPEACPNVNFINDLRSFSVPMEFQDMWSEVVEAVKA